MQSINQNENLLIVGEIIGSHGLDGEIKVRPYTESPDNFLDFEEVTIRDKTLKIRECRSHAGKVYLYLERINKRTTVDKIMGEKIYINRNQVIPLEEDEYFIIDLLGAQIINKEGNLIGILKDIKQTGMVDNYEIDLGEKTILVPALKENFEILNNQKIIAHFPEEYLEL